MYIDVRFIKNNPGAERLPMAERTNYLPSRLFFPLLEREDTTYLQRRSRTKLHST